MEFVRTVTTTTPPPEVFRYLADFRSTMEWDPGTIETVRTHGDGDVGTRYRNVSRFFGRETELTYVVVDLAAPERIALRGHNSTVRVADTMTIRARPDGGSDIEYRAGFTFTGAARLLTPVLWFALRRLVDAAARDLTTALSRLPS